MQPTRLTVAPNLARVATRGGEDNGSTETRQSETATAASRSGRTLAGQTIGLRLDITV